MVMVADSAIDPLTKEMIYIAVSTANGCILLRPLAHGRSARQGHDRRAAWRAGCRSSGWLGQTNHHGHRDADPGRS